MNHFAIIRVMMQVVEDYIYQQKGVRVQISFMEIVREERQINMLIDAYNHVTKNK